MILDVTTGAGDHLDLRVAVQLCDVVALLAV